MRIVSPDPVVGIPDHHRRPPRIGPEQPVDRRLLVEPEPLIAGHAPIQQSLSSKRYHEVVGAPDEWHPNAKAILCRPGDDLFESVAIVTGGNCALLGGPVSPQLVVPVVVPGIPLVVPSGVGPHPWRHRLLAREV